MFRPPHNGLMDLWPALCVLHYEYYELVITITDEILEGAYGNYEYEYSYCIQYSYFKIRIEPSSTVLYSTAYSSTVRYSR